MTTVSPIVALTSAEPLYFRSLGEAENCIEPSDVAEYRVFDASGQVLVLETVEVTRPWLFGFGRARVAAVRLKATGRMDPGELRRFLIAFLREHGDAVGADLESESLPALVERGLRACGFVMPHGGHA